VIDFMSPASLDQYLSLPSASGGAAGFFEGVFAPLQGWRFLNRHRSLWRYAVWPIVLNLVISVVVFLVLLGTALWVVWHLHPWLTQDLSGGWWWLAVLGEVVVGILLLLVCALAVVVTWKLLTGILCGYFYGRLAERVERDLGVADDELRSVSLVHELLDTALSLTLLVTVNGTLLLLNIVPVIGGLIAVIGGFCFTTFILGLDYMGIPLSLRGVRRGAQYGFAYRHRTHTMGLGTAVLVVEFIPILGAVLLTTAAVGAVLLHRKLQQGEACRDDTAV
jgi:uncharacterized protein involved in cysteine biosynthesis